jgi:hypothetical protein
MTTTTMSETSAAASPASTNASDGYIWDVQEILAERSSVSGGRELLVVWKTSWIPKENMIADGPIMSRFRVAPKAHFFTPRGTMQLSLAVEPGTSLAQDVAIIASASDMHLHFDRPFRTADSPTDAAATTRKRRKTGKQ